MNKRIRKLNKLQTRQQIGLTIIEFTVQNSYKIW